ncbi:MAG: HTTM domain-containing protein, partial [Candidatus Melainabacteria bacterium]|nr:HTTM domain-containing protein [Candidatus Melainabacteria bacterium]
MKLENPKAIFRMDIRALSIFRIALALLIIYDLTTRLLDLNAHYTDSGILPRQVILNDNPLFQYLYIHFFSGNAGFEIFVFVIAYIFAFLLLLGYKTRLATIISWYLLISLHARNHFILYGSDILLRMILFWSMFLPLSLCYSVDSILNKTKKHESNLIFSGWTVGYIIQIAFVYFFTALLKSGAEWHKEGSAIYYALNLEIYARPFVERCLQLPGGYLKLLTNLVLWFEYSVPFLLFSPIFMRQIRILTIIGLVILHLGFNIFLDVGHFGICSIIAMIPLFPIKNKIDNPPIKPFSIAEKIAVPLLIIYILVLNIATANPNFKLHKSIFFIAKYLQLDQSWGMFAPHPAKEDLWPVIIGNLKNKETTNLLTRNKKISFQKPDSLLNLFPNIRWRSFINLITKTKNF